MLFEAGRILSGAGGILQSDGMIVRLSRRSYGQFLVKTNQSVIDTKFVLLPLVRTKGSNTLRAMRSANTKFVLQTVIFSVISHVLAHVLIKPNTRFF